MTSKLPMHFLLLFFSPATFTTLSQTFNFKAFMCALEREKMLSHLSKVQIIVRNVTATVSLGYKRSAL